MTNPTLTEDERASRRTADRKFAQDAVEQLRSSEGWQAWLRSRRHFHNYSFANQLLIAMQQRDATRVAGFRAWLKLGYCVQKGERALRIWVPIKPTKQQLERWEKTGADPSTKPRTHFKLGPVFDRTQVQELPPPAIPAPLDPPIQEIQGDSLSTSLRPLSEFAATIGSTVDFEAMSEHRGGYYELESKRIAINNTRTPNSQVKTLVHELAHALIRADHKDGDPDLDLAAEELVVECVAYTVCGSVGLDTGAYSIPYLASWSEGTPITTIEQTAALIDRLARRLETALADRAAQPAPDPAAPADGCLAPNSTATSAAAASDHPAARPHSPGHATAPPRGIRAAVG